MTRARDRLVLLVLILASAIAHAQEAPRPGAGFELTDQHGRPFSSAALSGRPYALFFGFTRCPDVCPTTLLQMSNHLAALGPDADKLAVIFITVDPEADRPEVLGAYLQSFDPRIVGLTGTAAQIAAVAKAWNAFYNRIPEADGSYTIVHSAYVYLMDRDNRAAGTLGFTAPEAEQRAKLRALVAAR